MVYSFHNVHFKKIVDEMFICQSVKLVRICDNIALFQILTYDNIIPAYQLILEGDIYIFESFEFYNTYY